MMRILLGFCSKHNCEYIVQAECCDKKNVLNFIKRTKYPIKIEDWRFRTFNDVHPWFQYLRWFDLVVSTRIHGAMAPTSSGVPAVVLPTDFRILEMIDAHQLPHLQPDEIDESLTLEDIMELAHVDFHKFEDNRRTKLRMWQNIIESAGLEINPG